MDDGIAERARASPVAADGKVALKDDLPRDYKEEYRNFIEQELPKLADTIKARWVASTLTANPGGGEGGFAGGGFGPQDRSAARLADAHGAPSFSARIL